MRCGRATVWIAISALMAAPLQAARLGLAMKGDELLIEASREGPGGATPGIYAVTTDGEVVLAVTYGRSPRWSPDHKRFAFLHEGHIWIADVATRTTAPFADNMRYGSPPTAFVETMPFPHALVWSPDGRALGTWVWESGWGMGGNDLEHRALYFFPTKHDDAGPEWRLGEQRWVGRISFCADGSLVAYEVYDTIPGLGASTVRVVLFERATNQRREIRLAGVDTMAILNPLLSPGGGSMSVDCILRTDRHDRRTFIVDAESGRQTALPKMHPVADCSTTGIGRSPNGQSLLVVARWASGARTQVCVVSSPEKGETAGVRQLNVMCPATRWACFSPDGRHVAVFGGQSFDLAEDVLPMVLIVDLRSLDPHSAPVTRALPEGLKPVVIDW